MGRFAALGVTSGLLWIAASVAANAAPRGSYFSSSLAPRSPEVMLYISHSVGTGGAARPTFGLKLDQIHQASNNGDPEGADTIQHRELVNWQMEAHSNFHISDLRVQLGRKVTYDVTNRSFGSQAARYSMPIGAPTLRNGPFGPSAPKPVLARAATSSATTLDSFRDSSGIRAIAAAAVAALSPARFTPAQRQMAQRQGLGQRSPATRPGYRGMN